MNADNIEEILKTIGADDVPAEVHKIAQETSNNFSRSLERSTQPKQHILWEYFMRSRITKIAAAAVIVIAVMLAFNPLDRLAPAAYALEQTVQANNTIRSLYVRDFKSGEDEPKEFWLQFNEQGQIESVRAYMPEWNSPSDGAKTIIWQEGKATVWFKKKNSLLTVRDQRLAEQTLGLARQVDPKLAMERLYDLQKQGKVKVEINEPSDSAQSIAVTATYEPEGSRAGRRVVLFVDQATKLVSAKEIHELKDGEYQQLGRTEFHDYNQAIEPRMFTLEDEIPADVLRVDQTTQQVGLAQGDLSDEEIAVEVVRQFFTALIAEDYAAAGQVLEGIPADKMGEMFGSLKVLRIISIGPAGPHPNPEVTGLVVPSTVEVRKDGQVSEWKLDRLGVRQVYNQPGRWTIFGGI
jgi:hypothetical protein